jgi:hypothetical protein
VAYRSFQIPQIALHGIKKGTRPTTVMIGPCGIEPHVLSRILGSSYGCRRWATHPAANNTSVVKPGFDQQIAASDPGPPGNTPRESEALAKTILWQRSVYEVSSPGSCFIHQNWILIFWRPVRARFLEAVERLDQLILFERIQRTLSPVTV